MTLVLTGMCYVRRDSLYPNRHVVPQLPDVPYAVTGDLHLSVKQRLGEISLLSVWKLELSLYTHGPLLCTM